MAIKHAALAAALGLTSFALGWVGTAQLMLPVAKKTVPDSPQTAIFGAFPKAADTSVVASRPPEPETRFDRYNPRASESAASAIAIAVSPKTGSRRTADGMTAYAPSADPGLALRQLQGKEAEPSTAVAFPEPPAPQVDMHGLQDAIALYRKGDLLRGDALARSVTDPLARTTLEWLALRANPRAAGFARIMAFLKGHPDWPAAAWLQRKAEETINGDKRDPAFVLAFFATDKPVSPSGKVALARALLQSGQPDAAAVLIKDVWRNNDLSSPAFEGLLLHEFGTVLTTADHKFRTDRLLYREAAGAALRAAENAGPGVVALAKARIAASKAAPAAGAMLDALPASFKTDPGFIFSSVQVLRHSGRLSEAAAVMLAAPHDAALLVDGDAWWAERRILARKLIDEGELATAYRLCAEHGAVSRDARVEAEFHAGWIALRFLNDANTAAAHFSRAAGEAEGPADKARAGYWQGRAAEELGDMASAKAFYIDASRFSANYYGQLALAKSGAPMSKLRQAPVVAVGDARNDAVKVAEILYALGDNDLAMPLVVESVQHLGESQIAAMGAVAAGYHDARATLIVGKLASLRGFALDDLAFPLFGIPNYEPVANSAEKSVVYAIARQESAFQAKVVSSAGAKGLMQMMPATARITASRAGLPFNEAWLTSDPSFNAKLGAAHLGSLLNDQNGSYIMTFAAYNAGGGAVRRWINAYGDPRDHDIDPVDWVELIPFTETRHYVQTVMENMEMYRLRFGERNAMVIESDLRHTKS